MHPKFLDILCCPETGEPLSLHADERAAERHGRQRHAHDAVRPRRTRSSAACRGSSGAEQYASSFGYEWTPLAARAVRVGERRPADGGAHDADVGADHRRRRRRRSTGKTIVDFGCGPGRFLDVVRRKGGIAVGIDLSGAVDAARRNFADDPDVLIVQGDLLNPPFRPGVFDGGFSIGVLHHTPDPAGGLAALARTLRAGGWVACCVYPKGDFYDFPSVRRFAADPPAAQAARSATASRWPTRTSPRTSSRRCSDREARRRPAPASRTTSSETGSSSLWLKDPRWRVLDMFDAITPEIATTHTREEVAAVDARRGIAGVAPHGVVRRRPPSRSTRRRTFAAARGRRA